MSFPEIILFGGAFDPPHQGHVECVEQVQRRFPDAVVWIVPVDAPPGVAGVTKKLVASFDQRKELCERAFASQMVGGRVMLSPIERRLPKPNLTVQTIPPVAFPSVCGPNGA